MAERRSIYQSVFLLFVCHYTDQFCGPLPTREMLPCVTVGQRPPTATPHSAAARARASSLCFRQQPLQDLTLNQYNTHVVNRDYDALQTLLPNADKNVKA